MWVPKTSSGPSTWTFIGVTLLTKTVRATFLPHALASFGFFSRSVSHVAGRQHLGSWQRSPMSPDVDLSSRNLERSPSAGSGARRTDCAATRMEMPAVVDHKADLAESMDLVNAVTQTDISDDQDQENECQKSHHVSCSSVGTLWRLSDV